MRLMQHSPRAKADSAVPSPTSLALAFRSPQPAMPLPEIYPSPCPASGWLQMAPAKAVCWSGLSSPQPLCLLAGLSSTIHLTCSRSWTREIGIADPWQSMKGRSACDTPVHPPSLCISLIDERFWPSLAATPRNCFAHQ